MSIPYDYRKYRVLYADDVTANTRQFQSLLEDTFDIDTAASGEEGLEKFQKNPDAYGIVMSDQRMPGASGTDLLSRVRAIRPRTVRILTTAYSDLDAAIASINSGAIYKYIHKPWNSAELEISIRQAMELYILQHERDQLMREKLSALQRLMMTDRLISLGIFAAGLNHHMRNALTAVKTFLDLAPLKLQSENIDLAHLRNPDYWTQFYATVQQSMNKVLDLLKEVQDIPARAPAPDGDTVEIPARMTAAIQRLATEFNKRSVTVESFPPAKIPAIAASARMIDRLFDLLLADEAANVTPGGRVNVSMESGKATAGWDGVRIRIEDSGPGLSPANVTCLFDPFFTRGGDPGQYGLNLLAAFFLVHHHSGTISVGSSELGGACFDILLPLDPAAIPAPASEEAFLQRVMDAERAWEKRLIGD